MRDAARALDDVSDHLGEVLRHADELLAEWARFGAQVRTQVDREAAAIGAVVDGAVERAASAGIDRAIAERLRALTAELERLEQRARAASRVATEQRQADRRVLWIVVAGVVLANALLVLLLLRKPEPLRVPAPIRVESTIPAAVDPGLAAPPATGSAGAHGTASEAPPATGPNGSLPAGASVHAGSNAGSDEAGGTSGHDAAGAPPGVGAPVAGKPGAPGAAAARPEAATPAPAKPGARGPAARSGANTPAIGKPAGASRSDSEAAGAARPMASPIVLPPKAGTARPHKKQS